MFTIFIRGTDVGQEQVALVRSGSQWIISATGRLGDFTLNRFEVKYAADWQPIEMHVEGTQAGKPGDKGAPKKLQVSTSFAVTSAINEITQNGVTNSKTDQISARTRRPADQRLRRIRGARGTARQRQCRNRAPNLRGSRGRSQGERQGNFGRSGDDARRRRQDTKVRAPRSWHGLDVHDERVRRWPGSARPARYADQRPERRSKRPRRCRRPNTDCQESDRLRRDHSSQWLQHRRHDHDAAGPRTAAAPRRGARGERGPARSRRHRCRHPDTEPARRRPGATGIPRRPLRQARRRPERRPERNRHAARLRRRPHRHRQMARQARRCRPAQDCRRRPQRRRHDRHARGQRARKRSDRSCCWRRAGRAAPT